MIAGLCVNMGAFMSIWVSLCQSVRLCVSLCDFVSVCATLCQSVCLCVNLGVCLNLGDFM